MEYMSSVLNKVKDWITGASKEIGKSFTDWKLGQKFKVAGNEITGTAKTNRNFIRTDENIKKV